MRLGFGGTQSGHSFAMSWSGYERALPPEMIPNRLFDRLFGARDTKLQPICS
jgi:hypothetical protein